MFLGWKDTFAAVWYLASSLFKPPESNTINDNSVKLSSNLCVIVQFIYSPDLP